VGGRSSSEFILLLAQTARNYSRLVQRVVIIGEKERLRRRVNVKTSKKEEGKYATIHCSTMVGSYHSRN
jgi:hypothetical protein